VEMLLTQSLKNSMSLFLNVLIVHSDIILLNRKVTIIKLILTLERTMEPLIQCLKCESTEFEIVHVVQITKWWDQEYKGFFSREPTPNTKVTKLRCAKCGVFYKENG
jgi:hypothetical protein